MLELLIKYILPSPIILPQVGISGGTPAPKKLRLASAKIADANKKVNATKQKTQTKDD